MAGADPVAGSAPIAGADPKAQGLNSAIRRRGPCPALSGSEVAQSNFIDMVCRDGSGYGTLGPLGGGPLSTTQGRPTRCFTSVLQLRIAVSGGNVHKPLLPSSRAAESTAHTMSNDGRSAATD